MSSVMGVGVTGIHAGLSMLDQHGSQIASMNIQAPAESNSQPGKIEATLETAIVGQLEAKTQVQASAKVVEAGSEILGTLLDVRV